MATAAAAAAATIDSREVEAKDAEAVPTPIKDTRKHTNRTRKDAASKTGGIQDTWILTRFEKTTIVGRRMEQLQRGAEPLVPVPESKRLDVRSIAVMELEAQVLPFIVERSMPDGSVQARPLSNILFPK